LLKEVSGKFYQNIDYLRKQELGITQPGHKIEEGKYNNYREEKNILWEGGQPRKRSRVGRGDSNLPTG